MQGSLTRRRLACLAAGGFALLSAPAAADGIVRVEIGNVRNARGLVRAALCSPSEFLGERCRYMAAVRARAGTVQVEFTGVAPGRYAVQAWHDENDNGKIDRDLLGIPSEGVGFSNDPVILLGPPSFKSASFPVALEGGSARLTLRYFK